MTDQLKPGTRWRLFRDVVVFQIKLGLEALLDLTLIPVSLAAAGLDLVFGHWQRPRWFHRVLRFGEACERRLDLWGAAKIGEDPSQAEVDAVKRGIEHLVRNSGLGPDKVRDLRRWAATKLAPGDEGAVQSPNRGIDPPG